MVTNPVGVAIRGGDIPGCSFHSCISWNVNPGIRNVIPTSWIVGWIGLWHGFSIRVLGFPTKPISRNYFSCPTSTRDPGFSTRIRFLPSQFFVLRRIFLEFNVGFACVTEAKTKSVLRWQQRTSSHPHNNNKTTTTTTTTIQHHSSFHCFCKWLYISQALAALHFFRSMPTVTAL